MTKRIVGLLALIGLCVIVLLLNGGQVRIDLLVCSIRTSAAFVHLAFIAAGVAIGLLLK